MAKEAVIQAQKRAALVEHVFTVCFFLGALTSGAFLISSGGIGGALAIVFWGFYFWAEERTLLSTPQGEG